MFLAILSFLIAMAINDECVTVIMIVLWLGKFVAALMKGLEHEAKQENY